MQASVVASRSDPGRTHSGFPSIGAERPQAGRYGADNFEGEQTIRRLAPSRAIGSVGRPHGVFAACVRRVAVPRLCGRFNFGSESESEGRPHCGLRIPAPHSLCATHLASKSVRATRDCHPHVVEPSQDTVHADHADVSWQETKSTRCCNTWDLQEANATT